MDTKKLEWDEEVEEGRKIGRIGNPVIFGDLYMLGGNLSECVISGRIAGREAANEEDIQ